MALNLVVPGQFTAPATWRYIVDPTSIADLATFTTITVDSGGLDPLEAEAQIVLRLEGAGGKLDFSSRIGGAHSVRVEDIGLTSKVVLTGTLGDDVLNGSAFADTLNGGVGADAMTGGAGNDTYYVDDAGDTVTEIAGGGIDTVRTTLSTYALGTQIDRVLFTGLGNFVGTGNGLANRLTGGAGTDTLSGEDGDDVLDGRSGADGMTGGAGNDTYYVDDTGDTVTEGADGGTDAVQTTLSTYTLASNVERLEFTGSGNFTGTGNALANILTGAAGNDALNGEDGNDKLVGGLGDDAMTGGAGNDTYYVDDAGDGVTEIADGGIDTVRTTLSTYTLTSEVERLVFTGSGAFAGTGNELANVLTGGAGNDTLSGNDGDDSLEGGTGADAMTGGAGNDTYYVDAIGDTVMEIAGGGIDTVRTTLSSYALGFEVDRLVFTGSGSFAGTGNGLANVLTGGAGADSLDGGLGNDTIVGAQNDALLDGGGGTDTLRVGAAFTSTGNFQIVNIEKVQLTQAVTLSLANQSEGFTITGSSGVDSITGGAGNDRIVGDLADTLLDGGAGFDTLAVAGSGVTLDLTNFTQAAKVTGIEAIDLTGKGNNTLVLDRLAVLAEVGADGNGVHVLKVDGNAGDTVSFTEAQWANAGAIVDGTVTYDRYVNVSGDAEVRVEQGVTVSFPAVFDLTFLNPSQGFIIQGDEVDGRPSWDQADDRAGWSVSSAGDVNGDGFADLIVGAWKGDDGDYDAGEAYVVFGKASGFGTVDGTGRAVMDLSFLLPSQGFLILGDANFDNAGFSVSSAGNVNGDGFADVIVGARGGNDGGSDAGEAYVVFGKASGFGTVDGTGRAVIDLANIASSFTPDKGFIVQGDTEIDFAGYSVSSAGDVNGDGFADVIVGAFGGGDGGTFAGEAYVVFGKASGFGTVDGTGRAVIDLSNVGSSFAPDKGFLIQGDRAVDRAGTSVSLAGDVNGDGFADLIVGAMYGDDGGSNAGEAYVVFGKASGFGTVNGTGRAVIDLTGLSVADGFIVQGDTGGGNAGRSVSSAGDVNGDGFADLIVGAPFTHGGGSAAGAAYVVFGKASGFGAVDGTGRAVIDLANVGSSFTPDTGFIIQGADSSDFAGWSVSSAGDVNGDGFADLIVGARGNDAGGNDAGEAYVVFGKASGFGTVNGTGRAVIDLDVLSAEEGFAVQGDTTDDRAGFDVSSAGDVNGDGFADLLVGAPYGDDGGDRAGETYVLFGGALGGSIAPVTTTGTTAAEILVGDAGNDTLSGGGGADVIRGGAGDDTISVGDSTFRSVDGGGGSDTLRLAANITSTGDTQISNVEQVVLTQAVTLNLASQTEGFTITGSSGADSIAGGTAPNSISAGTGNDTIGGSQRDTLLDGGADTDTLQVGANFTATGNGQIANIENVTLTAAVTLNLANQAEGFTITGSSGADSITGGSGADSIAAGAGGDMIVGAQNDTLLDGGADTDTLQVGAAFTSTGNGQIVNIENVTLTAAVTLNLANQSEGFTITGSSGADSITGGTGDDTIVGDMGDTLLDGAAGFDTLALAGSGVTLDFTDPAQAAKVTGIEAIDLTGTGNNALTLDRLALLNQVAANEDGMHVLTVDGDAGDRVSFTEAPWANVGSVVDGAVTYDRYVNGDAEVRIEQGVEVSFPALFDLTFLKPSQGFIIQGDTAGDWAGWSVSSAGDVNGDGFADMIVGARYGDDGGTNAGEAYVVFGRASGFGTVNGTGRAVIDLSNVGSSFTPDKGFIIQGGAANDYAGWSVSSVGDVNGDGFADLIVGAPLDGDGGGGAGGAYVVFGKASGFGAADGTGRAVIVLPNAGSGFTPDAGFVIQGDVSGDFAGFSVSSAGDVNGDGFVDMIVGARGGSDGGSQAGEAYVVFGTASGFGTVNVVTGHAVVDLTNLAPANGFIVRGDSSFDRAGWSVSSAGDVNGDGLADVIVGAPSGSDGGSQAGEAYVVFGTASGFGATIAGRAVIDLTNVGSSFTFDKGFIIQGDAASDQAGRSVSSAGDVNGDGFADLIVGAPYGGDGGSQAGEAYVVFGTASGFGTVDGTDRAVIDLTTLASSAGFVIQGDTENDRTGWSVSSAGDVNGDGFADLIVGARFGHNGGYGGGDAYVVFGKASGFGTVDITDRAVFDLTGFSAADGFIIKGDTAGDNIGASVSSAGDINGDGFADLIVGAYRGSDGGGNAGEAYVLFGAAFGASAAPVLQTGTLAAEILMGGAGDDTLSGGGGADVIRGGAGDDTISVGDSTFRSVDGGGGSDTLSLAVSITSTGDPQISNIEQVVLTQAVTLNLANQTEGFTITGSSGTDSITGGTAPNSISAGAGNDTIAGTQRDKLLDGGADDDTLQVGANFTSTGNGQIVNIENVTLTAAATLNLANQTEGFAITGSSGADSIIGGSGTDTIMGDMGDTLLDGGADTDTLQVGANFTSTGNGQVVNVENVTLTAAATLNLSNQTEGFAIAGSSGADSITGGSGDDTILGDLDDTLLDGGAGTDALILAGSGVTLDLTDPAQAARVTGFEAIDIAGSGNNTLILDRFAVLDDAEANEDGVHVLTIDGNAGDAVSFADAAWVNAGTIVDGAVTYDRYVSGDAEVRIKQDVAVSFPAVFGLANLKPSQGFVIQGDAAGDYAGWSVSSAGDVNGDGFDDVIVGAPRGDDSYGLSGEAYVVFGKASGFGTVDGTGRSVIDLTSLAPTDGFIVPGRGANDQAGRSVSSAGDVNGDGFADLIVGAPYAGSNGSDSSYVVFGRASGFGTVDGTGRAVIDLTNLASSDGIVLQGDGLYDRAGWSVSSAGDVNGDGFADLIVGAPRGDDGGSDAGEAYVVFGKAAGFGTVDGAGRSVIDFTSLGPASGFVVQGDSAGDLAGWSVSSAGDINGDGFADLIVGAPYGSDVGDRAGEAYVVFGKASGFGTVDGTGRSVIDLTVLAPAAGFVIQGSAAFDMAGWSVSSAGDVNGDGFDDLIVGAKYGSDGGFFAGEAYVVFGKASGFGTVDGTGRSVIDLAAVALADGFIIQGDAGNNRAGFSVSEAGDVNGDGFSDLLVGAPFANGQAGQAYVVFGKESGFGTVDGVGRAVIDLTGLAPSDGFAVLGDQASDRAGYSVSAAGDMNGDGFADLIVGAPRGYDGGAFAGEAYVVFGGAFGGSAAPVAHTGTTGAEMLIGGVGNDVLSGGGGADVLRGGAGDDMLSVGDLAFRSIDGGSGSDTLVLGGSGQSFDFTALADTKVTSIETIDITGSGNNSLTLGFADVAAMTDGDNFIFPAANSHHALVVMGNAGDTLTLQNYDPDGPGGVNAATWTLVDADVGLDGSPAGAYDLYDLVRDGAVLASIAMDADMLKV